MPRPAQVAPPGHSLQHSLLDDGAWEERVVRDLVHLTSGRAGRHRAASLSFGCITHEDGLLKTQAAGASDERDLGVLLVVQEIVGEGVG